MPRLLSVVEGILRSLLETEPRSAVLVVDPAGNLCGWSEVATEITGVTAEHAPGNVLGWLFGADTATLLLSVAAAHGCVRRSLWLAGRQGEPRPVDVAAVLVQCPGEKPDGFVVLLSPPCSRDAPRESVGETASTTLLWAHDMNNLVTAALATASSLVRLELPSAAPKALLEITERMKASMHSLLKSTVDEVKAPCPLRLNGTICQVLRMLSPLLGDDLIVETHLESDLWLVRAGSLETEHVLMNLLLNAMQASPRPGRLVVETSNLEVAYVASANQIDGASGRRYVKCSIRDFGAGMSEETRASLFAPSLSFKADGSVGRIGLLNCLRSLNRNGGSLSIHAQPGLGTTVEVLLPATGVESEYPVTQLGSDGV
jgi:nitrogen-specific signal transduction histidine kinase